MHAGELAALGTATMTPPTMISMARASSAVTRSPSVSHASAAVKIGVTVDTTMVRRAPNSTYARNVHRSPRTMPTTPEATR